MDLPSPRLSFDISDLLISSTISDTLVRRISSPQARSSIYKEVCWGQIRFRFNVNLLGLKTSGYQSQFCSEVYC